MASLSIKIMAHRKREVFVADLVERLGILDEDVIWDTKQNRWDTGRRAWEAIEQEAEWGVVIQDDAIVCRDFAEGMELALDQLDPNVVVSPYVGTRRPMAHRVEAAVRSAIDNDAAWIRMPSLNWGVAIVLPTAIINDMLPWCDRQSYPNYDRRIGRYCIDVKRMSTICTWPSLVDHRDTPSLVGHGGGRYAHKFIGEDASALDVDWTKPAVTMGGTRTTAGRARRTATTFGNPRTLPPDRYDVTSVEGRNAARQLRIARRNADGTMDQPPVRPGS